MAQWITRATTNREIVGSNPTGDDIFLLYLYILLYTLTHISLVYLYLIYSCTNISYKVTLLRI